MIVIVEQHPVNGVLGLVLFKGSSLVESRSLLLPVMSLQCIVRISLCIIISRANRKIDKYNDDTGKYDQTVYINGESVSTLSTSE